MNQNPNQKRSCYFLRVTKVVSSPGKIAFFDINSNSINFANPSNIQASNLKEEFIHATQFNLYYPEMSNSKRNYEFEAKVFQDVECARYGFSCMLVGTIGMDGNIHYNEMYSQLMSPFYAEGQWGDESTELYRKLGEVWNQYPGVFDATLEPQLLINYLK